jgi:hypothetical protein
MKRRVVVALAILGTLIIAGPAPRASATVDQTVWPWGYAVSSNGTACGRPGAAGPCVVAVLSVYRNVTRADGVGSNYGTCSSSTGAHTYNFGAPTGACIDFNPASVLYASGPGNTAIKVWVRETCPTGGYAWSPQGSSLITAGIPPYSQYFGVYHVQKPVGGCQP